MIFIAIVPAACAHREVHVQLCPFHNVQWCIVTFIEIGVIKKDIKLPFLDRLINVSIMVNSFWMIDAELHFQGRKNKKLIHYLELCCSLIQPNLTVKAIEEYTTCFKKLQKY